MPVFSLALLFRRAQYRQKYGRNEWIAPGSCLLTYFSYSFLVSVSIFFDVLFSLQHYVIYPAKKIVESPNLDVVSKEPLLESSEHPRSADVACLAWF